MRHRAFTLENVHFHFGLVVGDGGEDAALLSRDVGVPLDERRERPILGLDSERVRGDVEQHEVGNLTLHDSGLNRGADGDHFVRVDASVRLPAEDLLDRLENLWRSCLTADRDDVVEVTQALGAATWQRIGEEVPNYAFAENLGQRYRRERIPVGSLLLHWQVLRRAIHLVLANQQMKSGYGGETVLREMTLMNYIMDRAIEASVVGYVIAEQSAG